MPELPEVENVRQGLEKLVKNKKILNIKSSYPRMVLTGFEELKKELEGREIKDIKRRGKYLLFDFGQWTLISHLRMEGKYRVEPLGFESQKHDHIFVEFSDAVLVYADVRKFGTWELLDSEKVEQYFTSKKIGPEPRNEDFDEALFSEKLHQSQKKIKPYLLDQTLVAGLGNIYVDEVLWRSQVHPETVSSELSAKQIHLIHDRTIEVLQTAVERGGSSIRTYKNAMGKEGSMQELLMVYGKQGEICPRCRKAEIEKIKVAGRGSHFCPYCQKIK
ncbi:DNA-formamidopyrimidine glycosylase [Lactococcus ileimucosae]|uniref:DNA-formamidopyrimidine glycosylase n=1 Tax=Lactococcus ileimucosae TaxID=2941329 RepID=UPI003518F66F